MSPVEVQTNNKDEDVGHSKCHSQTKRYLILHKSKGKMSTGMEGLGPTYSVGSWLPGCLEEGKEQEHVDNGTRHKSYETISVHDCREGTSALV